MKKQLLSIIAIILCLCTVFTLASCGKQDDTDESNSESLNGSDESSGEFDLEEGLEDVDPSTAEDIFAQMKAAYKATVDYKNAYSLDIKWEEHSTTTGEGKGSESTDNKYVTTETVTADPSANKAAYILKNEEGTQETKIFSQSGNNYIYSASKTNDQIDFDEYNLLSSYGLTAQNEIMLLSYYFGAESHFVESFGDPFSASSASDLKTIHTSVINEVKENQKAIYEAQGYTVKAITARANIIFNKTKDTNILKRTITTSCDLQIDGGTLKNSLTIESVLKTKDGKILSFVSTTSQSTSETTGDSYSSQSDETSSLSYEFTYSMNESAFNSIQTSVPASVATAPDYVETPLTLYINGEEVSIMIRGQVTEENSASDILANTLNELFADANIEYDGKWYTDSSCSKVFDISSVDSISKLESIGKLYNNNFKVNGNYALIIDSGKETVNIPKNYITVFGNQFSDGISDYRMDLIEGGNTQTVAYEPSAGYDVTIKLNGKELKYNENIDESDYQEAPTGEYFHEFMPENGSIYFVKRSNVATKKCYTLGSFYIRF